jgi:hypothetical protein
MIPTYRHRYRHVGTAEDAQGHVTPSAVSPDRDSYAGLTVSTEGVRLIWGGTRGRGRTRPEERVRDRQQDMVIKAMLGGLLTHLVRGSVLFPLGFLALPAHDVPGPPMLRGRLWAVCLWLALETLVAPLLGAGVFSAAPGGFPAALRALLGYLVYDATIGGLVGAPAPTDLEMAQPRRAGPKEADTDHAPPASARCRASPSWRPGCSASGPSV